jgi:hypothetical protein
MSRQANNVVSARFNRIFNFRHIVSLCYWLILLDCRLYSGVKKQRS